MAVAIAFKPVAARYFFGLFVAVMGLALGFIAGVEAIFLTDLIISRILPHVLDHRASLWNVLVLVVESMPSSAYVALPIALLASVYFVVLRRREAREFIILAGMGRGAGPIVLFAVHVGLAGLVLSVALSGYIEPLARYAAGRTMSDVRIEAIRNGALSAGKFYQLAGYTVFAGGGQTNAVADRVFFLQDLGESRFRLVTASQSQRFERPTMAKAGVVLQSAAAFDFEIRQAVPAGADPACADCARPEIVPGGARASNQIFLSLPDLDLPEIQPRGDKIGERTDPELVAGDLADGGVVRELGERMLRALLVLLAPLLAVLAVALTRPALFLLALPGAALIMLAGSFFGPRLVEVLASFGFANLVVTLAGGALALAIVMIDLIFRFESGSIQHGGVQP